MARMSAAAYVLLVCASSLMLTSSVESFASVLLQGSSLYSEQYLFEGPFQFKMQQDCNLVLYKNGRPIWATNTGGRGRNCEFRMQRDGNAVLYTGYGDPLFGSNTADMNNGDHYIVLQCDGNVVMYTANGRPVWATDTGGKVEVIDLGTAPTPTMNSTSSDVIMSVTGGRSH
ncbi:hypothetical protein MPTK1_3g22960 [Marchantia polymorpha subsp. ruderalis]|nr:hypothetical protein MARPO_0024s0073 [Marchantia polymorpha]BBN06659.1 hypothetical protein Mp_3g22960 [Marchantia polymorpha subsp. ruderalis]|eukprot:PTQ43558.1 hypothetical protein MARPO_0024s0073 [Marchantia polymorpha]